MQVARGGQDAGSRNQISTFWLQSAPLSLDLLLGVARVGQQVVEVGFGQLADELQPLHPKLVPRLVRPLLGDLAPPFLLLVLFDDCNNALVIHHPSRFINPRKVSSMPQCFHAPGPQVFSI